MASDSTLPKVVSPAVVAIPPTRDDRRGVGHRQPARRACQGRGGAPGHPIPLAERELEMLRLLAAGHSNRELSDALGISPTTAARHISNIFNKLDVDFRAKSTAYAYQRGII